MRQIKFRGRDVETGEYVYGDLSHDAEGKIFIVVIRKQDSKIWRVEPDSVEQLIGVDANGKEIYEGDTVKCSERFFCSVANQIETAEKYYRATFSCYDAIREGTMVLAEAAS